MISAVPVNEIRPMLPKCLPTHHGGRSRPFVSIRVRAITSIAATRTMRQRSRAVSFVREKFIWLDQVRADPELTPLAFMLAYVIANLVNEREGFAWPSVARLASECHVTERGVQKVIARLVERGHLSVEHGNGRGETNRFSWIVRNQESVKGIEESQKERRQPPYDGKARPTSPQLHRKGRTPVHPIEAERVNRSSEKGEPPFQKGRTPVHPTLSKEFYL